MKVCGEESHSAEVVFLHCFKSILKTLIMSKIPLYTAGRSNGKYKYFCLADSKSSFLFSSGGNLFGGFCLAGLVLPGCAGEVGAETRQRFSVKHRGEAELSRRSSWGVLEKEKTCTR